MVSLLADATIAGKFFGSYDLLTQTLPLRSKRLALSRVEQAEEMFFSMNHFLVLAPVNAPLRSRAVFFPASSHHHGRKFCGKIFQ